MSTRDCCQFRLERINMPEVILFDKPYHTYTCGRAKDNQIVCLSLTVSRRHCIFFHSKDELYVTDLKSANGLFINGVAQEPFQTTKLHPNDVIGVGCPDVDVKDKSMFAYILRLIVQPQTVPSNDATSTLSETVLNETGVSTRRATNDESDSAIKRKGLQNIYDVEVVPRKIPKLDNDAGSCSKKKPVEKYSDAMDENDLEVIHVSLNNSVSKSNHDNCDSGMKNTKLNGQSNLSKHADCDMSIGSRSVDDQKYCESSTNCEVKPDDLINSMNLESLVLGDMNSSIKDKQNSVGSCKNTFQNVQKSTENNLSNNKNKENLFSNTAKRKNKQSENRVEDASTKVSSKRNDKTSNGAMSSRLPSSFIHVGDTVIKLEEELQLTDTDEDAIFDSTNDIRIPIVSPIKLKQVQQQPKAKFSEEDVVNLSDTEDDIFPCSQLFDIGFGVNTSIKQEVKKEVKEEEAEVEHEQFSMLDDEDLVISLSDSDDEDKNWLRRLSRSQTVNEDDIKTETRDDCIIKEDMDIEIIDVQKPTDALKKSVDKLLSTRNERAEAEKDMRIEKEKRSSTHDVDEENKSLNEMHSLRTSLEKAVIDSVDRAANSLESSNKCTTTYQKSPEALKRKTLGLDKHETESRSTSTVEPVTTFRKKSLERKVPQIEPLHLPTTRRRSISANRVKQVPEISLKEKLSGKEKKELKEKAKLEEYMRAKDQKNRRVLNKWADCLPPSKKKISPLTKEEKKQLANDRKQKLKQIAMEEKRLSLENNQEKKRIATKPKAKISLKTRSDFLVEATVSATKLGETKEKPKAVNRPTIANNVPSPITSESTKSKEAVKKIRSHNVLGRIPKKSAAVKTKTNASAQDALEEVMLSQRMKIIDNSVRGTQAKNKSNTNSISSAATVPVLKPLGKMSKKRVSFSTEIKTVREYEIDESNVLKKLTGKDAPLPVRPMKKLAENEMTNQFLLRIFSWNPVWLEEQQRLNSTAPVVRDDELHVMLTHYKSYEEYYRIMSPLLLLETWYGITKEFQTIDKNCRRPTLMCSIVENSIETTSPSPNVQFTTLMLEVLVTREDLQKQAHPTYGDLVFFEYTRNQQKGQTFHKVFAYVENVHNTTLSDWTYYNKELANYVRRPYALITYTVQTRRLESNILVNKVRRLRSVTYLRPNLRMVQALEYLPTSPVVNLILNPKIEQYHLPNVFIQPEQLFTRDKLNPKQLEAVFKVTETIVQKQAKLCFIQGPPGTGKSKVIVNIVSQVLYGNNRYVSNESPLKILVCAPSNAAIDEITLRLLQIRSSMKQKRFKMVRIGRSEVMHPTVKDISVVELAKRDMKKTQTTSMNTPLDSVEEEKTLLESKINKLKCEIAGTHNMEEAYKEHLKMRLADMIVKYELLKNRRPLNEKNSKEFARIQRSAENRVLSHADIITCTLSSCYSKQMESLFVTNKKGISVCIVDEATQSIETETLIPLMLGVNTLVLVGDPYQLPATVLSPQAKKMGLDQSIFSRVQNAFEMNPINPMIMLDTQYRMQHDICSWPNKFFYAGKLKTAVMRDDEFPFHSYRIFHVNTIQNNDNFSNTNEAQFVANMIHSMLTHANLDGYDFISYGILTPYNNQKHVILKKINEKMLSLSENLRKKIKFEVNTVDGFQGQERDVIIMSCVRSQKIGFLSDRQRLCVALTRAKHSLIICGNFSVFNKDPMWNALLTDARSRKIYFNINAQADPHEIKQHVVKRFSS
nr:helicase SEN1 [Megalopta genalis]XP_033339289.1 helicase SEN1 [Megalopta genalis]XP_033339290.1 helicase SEN1 [Megalopta genalis]XP_033339291.1 helicase SEN1 [Megalopta genalis]XP_033339292.1 helicase SEN1 [Megalopta genalis]